MASWFYKKFGSEWYSNQQTEQQTLIELLVQSLQIKRLDYTFLITKDYLEIDLS